MSSGDQVRIVTSAYILVIENKLHNRRSLIYKILMVNNSGARPLFKYRGNSCLFPRIQKYSRHLKYFGRIMTEPDCNKGNFINVA